MKNEVLRLGLIGCGYMGNYYAHNISRIDGVEIILCCDPSPEKLEKFRKKWDIAESTTEWRSLLSYSLDGVINCALDSMHADIFEVCLASGIPILLEKPSALPLEMINTALKADSENDSVLQKFIINFSKRFLPSIPVAKQIVEDDLIGTLKRIELHYRQGWHVNNDFGDWREKSTWFWRLTEHYSNHGVLGDLGSHLLDIAVLFGGFPENLNCTLTVHPKDPPVLREQKLDSPDEAVCCLKFINGAFGIVNLTRAAVGEKDEIFILMSGTKGSIKIRSGSRNNSLEIFTVESGVWQFVDCSKRFERNYDFFIKGLKADDEFKVSDSLCPDFTDAVINQVLIEACAFSSKSGRTVCLEDFISDKPEIIKLWKKKILK